MKKLKALEILQQSRLRPTKARVLILSTLTGNPGHLCPDEILKTFRAKSIPFSPATLYQNLNKLTQAGLLRCIQGLDDKMHFDANLEPHHHLACLQCGRIADIKFDVPVEKHMRYLFQEETDSLDQWHLQADWWLLKGICPKCRPSTEMPATTKMAS